MERQPRGLGRRAVRVCVCALEVHVLAEGWRGGGAEDLAKHMEA